MQYVPLGRTGAKVSRLALGTMNFGRHTDEATSHLMMDAALAADLGVTPTALALGWLLAQPGVTAPVVGPRTLDQLTGSLPALDVTIDEETGGALDKLFPGPGGAAPDAYTWS